MKIAFERAGRTGRGPRLLIAEDEATLRESLASLFELKGFDVAQARTLAEAQRHLARGRFDAAVLDIVLPDGDGLTLLEDTDPRRSVVISAWPDPERYERMGVLHHLAKPFDLLALSGFVEQLIAEVPGAGPPADRRAVS